MFESEEPTDLLKYWAIPFFVNFSLWALTVCSAILYMTYDNHSLAFGPLPELAKKEIDALADERTVVLPIIVACGMLLITYLLSIRQSKGPKGRFNKRYLRNQFFTELRSFSLSSGSLSFSVFWFTTSLPLLTIAVICWALWLMFNGLHMASSSPSSLR